MSLATTTNYLAPTGREEPWRFTPLNRLAGLHDPAVALHDRISLEPSDIPVGVSITVEDASSFPPLSESNDQVVQRVREAASKVLVISIAKDAELDAPIILSRQVLEMAPEASRVQINAGLHSRATLVISNAGDGVFAEDVEFNLAPGSNLRFITLQEWSAKAVHVARHHAIIAKDAAFTSYVITVGGSLVRLLASCRPLSTQVRGQAPNSSDSTLQHMVSTSSIAFTLSMAFREQNLASTTKAHSMVTPRIPYGSAMYLLKPRRKVRIPTSSIATCCSLMVRALILCPI